MEKTKKQKMILMSLYQTILIFFRLIKVTVQKKKKLF